MENTRVTRWKDKIEDTIISRWEEIRRETGFQVRMCGEERILREDRRRGKNAEGGYKARKRWRERLQGEKKYRWKDTTQYNEE